MICGKHAAFLKQQRFKRFDAAVVLLRDLQSSTSYGFSQRSVVGPLLFTFRHSPQFLLKYWTEKLFPTGESSLLVSLLDVSLCISQLLLPRFSAFSCRMWSMLLTGASDEADFIWIGAGSWQSGSSGALNSHSYCKEQKYKYYYTHYAYSNDFF